MRVGLLEDDVAIQEMLLLVLQDEGHTVTNYTSAEACLEALGVTAQKADPPSIDILIVDWRLSGPVSGIEVIRQIRSISHLNNLPIILTTAATFHDTAELDHFQVVLLEKPFSVDEMIGLIKNLTQPLSST